MQTPCSTFDPATNLPLEQWYVQVWVLVTVYGESCTYSVNTDIFITRSTRYLVRVPAGRQTRTEQRHVARNSLPVVLSCFINNTSYYITGRGEKSNETTPPLHADTSQQFMRCTHSNTPYCTTNSDVFRFECRLLKPTQLPILENAFLNTKTFLP